MQNRIFREQWKIQKTDATIEGIRRYERTKIGTSKKLAYNLGVGREQKGKTWVIRGMTGKTKRAMCVNDAHGGRVTEKKGLKKDRKVPGAVTQHTTYITEAPQGASRTISLCSVVLYLAGRRSIYMQNLQNMSDFARYTFYDGACTNENCRPKRRKTYLPCRRILHFLLCCTQPSVEPTRKTHTLCSQPI
jgi:hypothetical protein